MTSSKVLKIGDETDLSSLKEPKYKHNPYNFNVEFKEHLKELLLSEINPISDDGDITIIERFGAGYYTTQNPPRRCYYFYFTETNPKPAKSEEVEPKGGHGLICGPTLNAQSVLSAVKRRLKTGNWIKDKILEVPAKSKITEHYIQSVVSDCLIEENAKLLNYVKFLHQLHKNK